jgi:hypothetical protein
MRMMQGCRDKNDLFSAHVVCLKTRGMCWWHKLIILGFQVCRNQAPREEVGNPLITRGASAGKGITRT